jgi:hypothetical protein
VLNRRKEWNRNERTNEQSLAKPARPIRVDACAVPGVDAKEALALHDGERESWPQKVRGQGVLTFFYFWQKFFPGTRGIRAEPSANATGQVAPGEGVKWG